MWYPQDSKTYQETICTLVNLRPTPALPSMNLILKCMKTHAFCRIQARFLQILQYCICFQYTNPVISCLIQIMTQIMKRGIWSYWLKTGKSWLVNGYLCVWFYPLSWLTWEGAIEIEVKWKTVISTKWQTDRSWHKQFRFTQQC